MRAVDGHLPAPFNGRWQRKKGSGLAAPSQIWRAAALRMPKGKNFDGLEFGSYAIIEMVMDAGKVNAADTGKSDVPSLRPDRWL